MLSHIDTMLVLFQSEGLALTWISTDSGEHERISPSRVAIVTGARQHAQYDSSRISLPANGGILEIAIDSIAQPA